jgi:hypothetical protein
VRNLRSVAGNAAPGLGRAIAQAFLERSGTGEEHLHAEGHLVVNSCATRTLREGIDLAALRWQIV